MSTTTVISYINNNLTLFDLIFSIVPEPPSISYSNRKLTSLEDVNGIEANIGDELTLLAGASVIITCPSSGRPTPTVSWQKDGEDLSVNGSVLTVKDATTKDSGVITCEAVNRAGRLSHSSELRVIGKYVNLKEFKEVKNMPAWKIRMKLRSPQESNEN